MKKELIYILKRVIIGVLIAIILFSIKSCQVKALTIDEVSWNLSTTQYIRGYHASSQTEYYYTSSSWGNFTTANYRSIYEFGAYVTNPICDDDYCLIENSSYILSFFINSNSVNFSNLTNILGDLSSFHLRVSYLNNSNSKTYITLQQSAFNYYIVHKVNDKSYQVSLIFTMPKLPSSSNSSHFIDIDFWVLSPLAYPDNQLLYTGTSNPAIGISNFSITNASPQNIFTYINKIDNWQQNNAIINEQQNTTQAIEDLNDSITSEAPPNLSSLNNSAGWLPPGPVDSILNLPLALLNNINTNLSKTCQPVILHIPLVDKDLPIPCITTLYEQMGIMTWVNTIGAIASAFILFSYFVKLYKWVDDTLTFRENNYIDNWGGV